MKKILMALAMTGFVYLSAEAQTVKSSCGTKQDRVCRKSSSNSVSCYKTKYAENFKVCKGNAGYYICCEEPNNSNSTRATVRARANQYRADDYQDMTRYGGIPTADEFVAPAPQSMQQYGANRTTSYEGYFDTPKGKMKVCYVGDNVSELTRAPWKGCNSPENDDADKNRQRNVNVLTAAGD